MSCSPAATRCKKSVRWSHPLTQRPSEHAHAKREASANTDDGNCFVYTSENIFATPLLFSDFRTWKTCGVFDGQTLTNTLVSDPVQEGGTDYTFPQASNDASVVCLYRVRPSPNVPRKDIIMGAAGIYTPLTSTQESRQHR